MMTEMNWEPVISLVGMTCAGKTAVGQTLLRNPSFGKVHAGSGTTERVSKSSVQFGSYSFVIADTPGFQNLDGLTERLIEAFPDKDWNSVTFDSVTLDEIIEVMPQGEEPSAGEFLHDARSWNQVQQSDLLLFVVDLSEDIRSGQEFPQLKLVPLLVSAAKNANKPLIVLFNKLGENPDSPLLEDWKKRLAEYGVTRVTQFDAHHRRFADEIRLWDLIAEISEDENFFEIFSRFSDFRKGEEAALIKMSCRKAALYLAKTAQERKKLGTLDEKRKRILRENGEKEFLKRLQNHEEDFCRTLMKYWNFPEETAAVKRNSSDLVASTRVDPEKFRVAAGAAAGSLIDIAACGGTFGSGVLLGAAAGAVVGKGYDYLLKKLGTLPKEQFILAPNYRFLCSALDRVVYLLKEVQRRGHTLPVSQKIELSKAGEAVMPETLEKLQMLANTDWTSDIVSPAVTAFHKIRTLFQENGTNSADSENEFSDSKIVQELQADLEKAIR